MIKIAILVLGIIILSACWIFSFLCYKKCKKNFLEVEKRHDMVMGDLMTIAKRLNVVEKINGRHVINPDRITQILKEGHDAKD